MTPGARGRVARRRHRRWGEVFPRGAWTSEVAPAGRRWVGGARWPTCPWSLAEALALAGGGGNRLPRLGALSLLDRLAVRSRGGVGAAHRDVRSCLCWSALAGSGERSLGGDRADHRPWPPSARADGEATDVRGRADNRCAPARLVGALARGVDAVLGGAGGDGAGGPTREECRHRGPAPSVVTVGSARYQDESLRPAAGETREDVGTDRSL